MFSVTIPCYNRIDQLARVLAGFCAQRASVKFEIFLIDNNGFEEDINALYCRYIDKLPLNLLRQQRLPHPRATSRARNLGLQLARYDWIINIDADCIPPPDYLVRIRDTIELDPNANLLIVGLRRFVCGDRISEEEIQNRRCDLASLPSVASSSNYECLMDRRYPEIEQIAESSHPWAYVHAGNLIYRRNTALKIGGYDEAFDGSWGYEDVEFAYRMITEGSAVPFYLAGIECYHQDSKFPDTASLADRNSRFNKTDNPNWARACGCIPGFKQFKLEQYRRISTTIKL